MKKCKITFDENGTLLENHYFVGFSKKAKYIRCKNCPLKISKQSDVGMAILVKTLKIKQ